MSRRTGCCEETNPPFGSRAVLPVGRLRVRRHLQAFLGKGRKKKNMVPDLPLRNAFCKSLMDKTKTGPESRKYQLVIS